MSIHSLHYLNQCQIPFDLIVADEIKDLWNAFSSKNCMKHMNGRDVFDDNYLTLCDKIDGCLKKGGKAFFMDALMPNGVKEWVRNVSDKAVIKTCKVVKDIPRTAHLIRKRSIEPMVKKMLEKLNDGKNIYVYYPYAGEKGHYKLSIRQFGQMLCDKAGLDFGTGNDKDIIIIQGDTDCEIKKQLKNVNVLWNNRRIILVNSATTIGVSYQVENISSVFLCWDRFIPISDILQTSVRCRKILDGDVYIWRMWNAGELQKIDRSINRWTPAIGGRNDNRYHRSFKYIAEFLQVENKANNWAMLVYLFEKTGHEIVKDYEIEFDDEFTKSLTEWKKNKPKSPFDFDDVPHISSKDAKILHEKEVTSRITEMEKWQLQKYRVCKSFLPDTPSNILRVFYDNKPVNRTMKILTEWYDNKDDEQEVMRTALRKYEKDNKRRYALATFNLSKGMKDALGRELNLTAKQKKAQKDITYRKYILNHFFGTPHSISKGMLGKKVRGYLESWADWSKSSNMKVKKECMIEETEETKEDDTEETDDSIGGGGNDPLDTFAEDASSSDSSSDSSDSEEDILERVAQMRGGNVASGDGFNEMYVNRE